VGFLKQGSPCFAYFFSAGAGVVVVVVVVPGAFAEDIGACAGAAGAAGAACSAAGAGASSFFLQPADMARARARQRAKEISFFIDDITSLFGRFAVGAHCALYISFKYGSFPPFFPTNLIASGVLFVKANGIIGNKKAHRLLCELFETGLTLFQLLLFCRSRSSGRRGGRRCCRSLSRRHRCLCRSSRCGGRGGLSCRCRSFFFLLAASGQSKS
jgi:hypothetical protein